MALKNQKLDDIPFTVKLPEVLKSLRFRLQFLFLLVALPAIMMIVALNLQERMRRIDEYGAIAKRTAENVVITHAELIEDTRRFLMNLAHVPAIFETREQSCSAFLTQTRLLNPRYVNLGVRGLEGKRRCYAKPFTGDEDVSNDLYFRKAIEQQSFAIDVFQFDRAAQIASINFAYPIYDSVSQTAPVGAVVAGLSLDWWSAKLETADLPEGTVAYIVDNTHNIIAAYPYDGSLVGKPLAEVGLIFEVGKVGEQEIISQPDGIRRVFRQSLLTGGEMHSKVYMSLGVPVDIGIHAANRRLTNYLLGLGAVLAAGWFIASRLMEVSVFNPIRAMNDEIQRMEQGGALSSNEEQDADGKQVHDFQGIMQSFRNISLKQLRVEKERDTKSKEMAALIDALPDSYFRLDRDGQIMECRRSHLTDRFIRPQRLIGHKMADMLPAEAGKLFEEKIKQHLETREMITWESAFEVSGAIQEFEARLSRIRNHDEIVLVVRNITEKKQALKQREIAESRLERIIARLPGVTMSIDMTDPKKAEVIYISSQCEAMWGYRPKEIYAKPDLLLSAHEPEDRAAMIKTMSDSARNLDAFKRRFQIRTKAGKLKWLEVLAGASRVEDGGVHLDGIILDVTTEVETQAQLEEQKEVAHRAQKHESIGQLTGGVAHDFNNLLAVIMGNLELLRDDMTNNDHLSMIDAGIKATKRGADLTRNMLAFARKARLSPEVVNLNQLVIETRSWAGRTLPASILIETSLSSGLWKFEADPSSTTSALLNLILNARDAMPNGGKLSLKTENVLVESLGQDSRQERLEPGRYVMLSVSDTGEGIPSAAHSQIFEPFFSTKPTGKGSGLGLSMVQGFMQQSGGRVHVCSELGVGTSFQLYFRAVNEPEEVLRPEPYIVENSLANGRRVLVVEDEGPVLAVIVAILDKEGYDVTSATTGDEAKEIFNAAPTFDLLLTDIVMPGNLQGTTLSKVLREQRPDLSVVFMSGYVDESELIDTGIRREDTRLMKPVRRAELLAAVSRALDD